MRHGPWSWSNAYACLSRSSPIAARRPRSRLKRCAAKSGYRRRMRPLNAFEFVLVLVLILFGFTIIRHKIGIPVRSMREMRGEPVNHDENKRLRNQVQQLQERIRVLERIVTDRGAETAAQIEALRERDQLEEED